MIIFISIILIVIGYFLGVKLVDDENTIGFYLCLGLILAGWFLVSVHYEEQPKAIDVYRNKTTLQITYRDGIPVDSVVIFKENPLIKK